MEQDYRIPRPVFLWILLTQAFLLLPHMIRYPLLLIPAWLFFSWWRIMVYRGRRDYPSSTVKTVLVVAIVVAVALVQHRFFTIETMVLLLLLAFLLKLVETVTERDLLVSVYLAYFVIVTELLFDQGILAALYMLIALLLVTATLIASYASREVSFWQPLRESGRLLAFSVPVMVVAFLVFPRLDPLWVLPQPSSSGKTGISDSMSPGTFSNLAETDELAFRVEFEGEIPPLKDMYWRGLVFTHFDGRTWRQSHLRERVMDISRFYRFGNDTRAYRYRIIMEPTQRRWMFVLNGTTESDSKAQYYNDFTLQQASRIASRQSWSFVSYPTAARPVPVNAYRHRDSLQLPKGFNPKALDLARRLRSKTHSDEDYLQRVLDYFRDNDFVYTLQPPLLGKNTIDEFLFRTRQGFCEHYAAAFAVLARAGGVPARVVAGYQGGDINPYEQHVTVRQLDAHAWVEVWLNDKGWVRMDPTYIVSPQRIEQGGQQALANEPGYLSQSPLSPVRYNRFAWARKLQYRLDQMNYLWHNWVLSYEGRKQKDVLQRLLGGLSLKRIALFISLAFVFTAVLLWVTLFLKYRHPPLSTTEKLFLQFVRKMKKAGLEKSPGQGVTDFCRLAAKKYPVRAPVIKAIGEDYILIRYADLTVAKKRRIKHRLRQNIRRFRVE